MNHAMATYQVMWILHTEHTRLAKAIKIMHDARLCTIMYTWHRLKSYYFQQLYFLTLLLQFRGIFFIFYFAASGLAAETLDHLIVSLFINT